MIVGQLAKHGINLCVDHKFSAEIEPFKQAFIQRNFQPKVCYRDITQFRNGYG